MVRPLFLKFSKIRRLDLRPTQVWHLSAPMAQKVAGPAKKQWPYPSGALLPPVQAPGSSVKMRFHCERFRRLARPCAPTATIDLKD
jgi:hypothetical protein